MLAQALYCELAFIPHIVNINYITTVPQAHQQSPESNNSIMFPFRPIIESLYTVHLEVQLRMSVQNYNALVQCMQHEACFLLLPVDVVPPNTAMLHISKSQFQIHCSQQMKGGKLVGTGV